MTATTPELADLDLDIELACEEGYDKNAGCHQVATYRVHYRMGCAHRACWHVCDKCLHTILEAVRAYPDLKCGQCGTPLHYLSHHRI